MSGGGESKRTKISQVICGSPLFSLSHESEISVAIIVKTNEKQHTNICTGDKTGT